MSEESVGALAAVTVLLQLGESDATMKSFSIRRRAAPPCDPANQAFLLLPGAKRPTGRRRRGAAAGVPGPTISAGSNRRSATAYT